MKKLLFIGLVVLMTVALAASAYAAKGFPKRNITDVVVWGGPARLHFHGIAPLPKGEHPLTGAHRINLTLRRGTPHKGWAVSLQARNLFDQKGYEPSPGPSPGIAGDYPLEGRSVMLEVQYSR